MRFAFIVTWIAALAVLPAGCGGAGGGAAKKADGRIAVVTAIAPVGAFVERVGGESVAVTVLVPQGQAAETWQLLPRQMEALDGAAVYFQIGLPFEEALVARLRETAPSVRVADLREGLPLRAAEPCDHGGGDDHGHDHGLGGADPHVWLDPLLVKSMSAVIRRELAQASPGGGEVFAANQAAFAVDLDRLHAKIAEMLAPVRGRVFYVFHPAFGYFADRYGLVMRAVEQGGKAPGARHMNEMAAEIRASGARALFTQPQFSTAEAGALAAQAGAAVVTLDDLAADYAANLESIARALAEALQ